MAVHWDLDDEPNEQQTIASPIEPVVMCSTCFYSRPYRCRPDDNITCYWDELTYSKIDKCDNYKIVQHENNADIVRWKLDT